MYIVNVVLSFVSFRFDSFQLFECNRNEIKNTKNIKKMLHK